MTASTQVKEYLCHIPEGQPFLSSAFRQFATTENIRQILNRLVKAGELRRVARGVFAKTKHVSKVGETLPSVSEVVEALAKATGETITIQGAEAARQLQLTTQVPMRLIFYTNGNTRTLKVSNRTVVLKHVNPSRLIAPGTTPGLVISALYYLGRDNVTIKTIESIKHHISSDEFKETINLIKLMPSWMSDIFYRYQQMEARDMRDIRELEKRLDFSDVINKTISYLKRMEKFPVNFDSLNVFILNMIKYLTALKLVSEDRGCSYYDFQNFFNSVIRTYMCELQFNLISVIEDALALDPKKIDTFYKLLKYIEEHQVELPKIPLSMRLVENLNFFNDIKYLRNLGQHFISKDIKKTEIKDRELASYIHIELDGADLRINPEIFKYLVKRTQEIFLID